MPDPARQAAALPYRLAVSGRAELLLITSSAGRWTPPKGWIDPGRTAEETAALEALEEAGVIGDVQTPALGQYRDPRPDGEREITLFALRVDRVLDQWQEDDTRTRQWFALADAIAAVEVEELARLIEAFAERF